MNAFALDCTHSLHQAGLLTLPEPLRSEEASFNFTGNMRRLEHISLRVMIDVLLSTGAITADNRGYTAPKIIQQLGVAPRHHWLIRRWLAALVDQQFINVKQDRYYWKPIPQCIPNMSELPDAYKALGFPSIMAHTHQVLLNNLIDLIKDVVTINELLFQHENVISLLASYQENYFTSYLNCALAQVVTQSIKPGTMSKLLELGGGAGLTTTAIFNTIKAKPLQYRFTDVSPLFTNNIKCLFPNHIGLLTSVLDINYDFASQAVSNHSVDIVVAGNVLHNAHNLSQTLQYIRRALKDGGCLLFTESTRENHAMLTAMQFLLSPVNGDAMIGCNDRRGKTDEVFIDAQAWHQELTLAGFSLESCLPPTSSSLTVAGQMLFIAKAV